MELSDTKMQDIISKAVAEALPPKMTLQKALALMRKVEERAAKEGVAAVVAVSDAAARPVAVHSMDGAYIASYDVAFGKAYTSAALKMSTLELKTLSQPGNSLYGIQHTNQGQIVIFGGGVPLWYKGTLIGGLGVSGGTEDIDSALAEYGAKCLEEVMTCDK